MKWKFLLISTATFYTSVVFADFEQGVTEFQQGNYASAIYEWRQVAEKGNAEAQYHLARMHENGYGVPKNMEKAKKWYSLSANLDYLPAQIKLADLHLRGIDGNSNPDEAALWYERAAEEGDAQAQFRLGLLYLEGRGVEQSDANAAEWFKAAANQDIPSAQNNLGSFYENGRGVEQNYTKAIEWYRQAAEANDPFAQNNLGAMYAEGRGVERNHAWAVFWFAMALQNGNEKAADNIDNSLEHLQATEVAVTRANIRAGKSTEHDIIAKYAQGSRLYILGSTDDWSQVYLEEEQRIGWISSSLLE